MLLLDYLNGFVYTNEDDLVCHFLEKFGVNVKIENDLYLFKYGQIEAKWTEAITHECRGIILRNTDDGWKVVSRPFDKFFNIGEGYCKVNDKYEIFNLSAYQKLDGTCAQVYFDEVLNKWRMSTLGTITPLNVGDISLTFDDLFWKVANDRYADFVRLLDFNLDLRKYTIICELCTVENMVLTRYEKDSIYLLGCRNKETGELVKIALPLDIPVKWKFSEIGISTIEEAKNWVELESKKTELYGMYNEGFVLYDDKGPVAKMKNSLYIQLHHTVGAGDVRCTRNKVIEAFICGNMDDIYPVLTPSMQEFADKLRDWWINKLKEISTMVNSLCDLRFETMKEYALYIQANIPQNLQALFYQGKTQKDGKFFFDKSLDISKWLESSYKKFEDDMKLLSGIN